MKTEDLELKELQYEQSKELVENCDSGCICDAISEIADNQVDENYRYLFDWCQEHLNDVNKGVDEFGSSGDIIKDLQASQFIVAENEIYEDVDNIIYNYAINYLKLWYDTITEEQLDKVEDAISKITTDNKYEDIEEAIDSIMKEDKEQ